MTNDPTADERLTGERLAGERYGRGPAVRARRRPWLIAGGVALVVLLVGWLGWTSLRLGDPEVSFQEIGFSTPSDGQAQITFQVRFAQRVPADARAACTVQAQNVLHTEVGRKDVTVGPAGERRVQVVAQLPTSERANAVVVTDCALL